MSQRKMHLPKVGKMVLRNFSLYENNTKEITLDLRKPVTCIIGANGLGKSTLLNCINYAITGCINIPGRKVKSVTDFYENNKYSFEYFNGRIRDLDRDFSTISITFYIGESIIDVTRRFFSNDSVVDFTCSSKNYNTYEEAIIELMGLQSFEQFVFLQLKVFTFDEERECLFWRPDLITPTLYLTMGLDPKVAEKADSLARESQKINSRIRNLQFEINKMVKRIGLLESVKADAGNSEDDINWEEELEKYEALSSELDQKRSDHKKLEQELNFTMAHISELSIKQSLTKTEYDNVYKTIFSVNKKETIKNHHIISSLYKGNCELCNTSGESIWTYANVEIQQNKCPICHSDFTNSTNDNSEMISRLEKIDSSLHEINKEIDEHTARASRTRSEISSLRKQIEELNKKITPLDSVRNQLGNKKNLSSEIQSQVQSLKDAINLVENEKFGFVEERDGFIEEARKLHNELTVKYEEAQFKFIPKFRGLARAFTGLDVDISISRTVDDAREMLMFTLVLGESSRTNNFQLSESQRFFLDIALRMAIVDYISDSSSEGCVLIDTPEGSLDIAYETNAGEMFSKFVKQNHQLIITANLNSSGLIRTLARQTGRHAFNIVNMLLWANLSTVQRNRPELFKAALKEIEDALDVGEENELS